MSSSHTLWADAPKVIAVVVDNDSWILPFAKALVSALVKEGHTAHLCRSHQEISQGDIAFYLGCIQITPDDILRKNSYNLVVHESDLPAGRGFAPLTWQILEGRNEIVMCLIEAASEVDAGVIYLRDTLEFEGHELNAELREAQGRKTVEMCLAFCGSDVAPQGREQLGPATHYPRRRPKDSELDPQKSIAAQFPLLRVVDNKRYPAFFIHEGQTYRLQIDKIGESE